MSKTFWTVSCLLLAVWTRVSALDLLGDLTKEKLAELQLRRSAGMQLPAGKLQAGMSSLDQDQETSVDSNQYIVGAGDEFLIQVKELPSEEFKSTVRANGSLLANDFGEIPVSRIPLKDAYASIRQQVARALKKGVHVYVSLVRIKKVTVNVVGPLINAGAIRVNGNDRLVDALKAANNGYFPSLEAIDLRSVVVRNGDSSKTYDLARYLKHKDSRVNPYVSPGDEILISSTNRRVFLGGQVLLPAEHQLPLKEGETLNSFLEDLVVFRTVAETKYFFVRREFGSLEKVPADKASSFLLVDNDWIIVPSKEIEWRNDTISVVGEVRRPGTLPIQSGKTTAAQVLEWAGGPTDDGDMSQAVVIRRSKITLRNGAEGNGDGGSQKSGQATMSDYLATGATPNVRPELSTSYEHLKSSSDFAVIRLEKNPEGVVLEENDELVVPLKARYVYLSGQVKTPGAYLYHPEKSLGDYVRMAGGYTSKADGVNAYVVTRYTKKVFQVKDPKRLAAGDIVVVPTSPELKNYKTVFLPTTQAVLGVLSLVLSLVILLR